MELWKTVEPVKRIWSFGSQLNLLNGYGALENRLSLLNGY